MDNNIIINLQIDEEEIQSHAEANYGRELTPLELYRIKEYWYECEDADWERMQFMDACIRDAMNNKSDWGAVDKEFEEKQKDQKLPT